MKRRSIRVNGSYKWAEDSLCQALLEVEDAAEMRAFLRDLCTPAELEALTDRWQVVPYLLEGMPYREIHEHTGVSITTIGRVARYITDGNGGYMKVAAARVPRQTAAAVGSLS